MRPHIHKVCVFLSYDRKQQIVRSFDKAPGWLQCSTEVKVVHTEIPQKPVSAPFFPSQSQSSCSKSH